MHSRNVNNVVQIRAAHNALANRRRSKRKHVECGQRRVRVDEQCVQDLISCVREFDSFPFNPASPTLRTLQPASNELIADFNSAHAYGEEKLTSFLRDRVFSKVTTLHSRVPLSKRLTSAKGYVQRNPGRSSRLELQRWNRVLSRQSLTSLRSVNLP